MTELPKTGDVLIVTQSIITGKKDFTFNLPAQKGTLCVVIESFPLKQAPLVGGMRDAVLEETILTLLFPEGVIEWQTSWSYWFSYLTVVSSGES